MPTVIGRTARVVPADQTREIRLARTAISRLTPGFTRKSRQILICDLLGRLSVEKERRRARNLNHWEVYAPARIPALAEELLAERGAKITAYLKAHWKPLNELAWRVTRDISLADQAVARTAWEFWEGRTDEEVCYRALKMNARDLLGKRATKLRRSVSLDGMLSTAAARGEDLDFPSHRFDDQDPLEILLAREEQRETDDELEYALRNVRRRGNRWVLEKEWWKKSAFAELEWRRHGSDSGGSPE